MVDFFKSPAIFLKQFRRKFSQFEKPYLEGEYKQMHLDWPGNDWPSWKPWEKPPAGPFPDIPGYEPGRNVFNVPPDDEDRRCDQGGCLVIDWPPFYVEPGELHKIYISTGVYPVVRVEIDGPIIFTHDCIGKANPSGSLICGVYCGGWMQVKGGAEGEGISVTFKTADGGSCCYTGEVIAVCDPLAVIQYTTLQMAVDEEQGLSASESGAGYTWTISSGGGSLSKSEGNSTVYTAPSTNANCTANPTIQLSCDGNVIDSITIAINQYTGTAWAYKIWQDCEPHGEGWAKLMDAYDCNNVHKFGPNYSCTGTDEADCIASCPATGMEDVRTQAMKDAGCCPEALI